MRVLGMATAHDSSVAVVNDGQLEYFCKEERITRNKREQNALLSLDCAIKHAKGKIDYAVISSPTLDSPVSYILSDLIRLKLNLEALSLCAQHHLTHASLAFYNSGFEKCLVFVIDRNGSLFNNLRESETVFFAKYPNIFNPLHKAYWVSNIGEGSDVDNHKTLQELTKDFPDCDACADSTMNITKVYESATTLIGQHALENGKTMGLAAYGKDKPFKSLFVDDLPNTNLFMLKTGGENQAILKEHLFHQVKNVPEQNYDLYADYAYQVQKQTQQQVLKLVRKYVNKTGIKKVCITGGYGLNVVTNEYLIKNLPDVDFYIEPLADDSGNSIGAAFFVYREMSKDNTIYPLKHTFFNHIEEDIDIDGEAVTTRQIAEYLSQSKVVAVFKGLAEGGPRALGNRSILFDARNPNAKQIVNRVKNREWYRPFACSILVEHVRDYFETHNLTASPFMTVSFQVKKAKKNVIPGVIHVDNSCRIQTVDKDIPHYYDLLTEFYKITNVPVLMNTSFNMAGEPLVQSLDDTLRTFRKTSIDILWFPEKNMMIKK